MSEANNLIEIVEGMTGALKHGTWRDGHGMRLKDTTEWVEFYNSASRFESGWEDMSSAPKDRLIMLALYPHPGLLHCPRKVGGWWDDKWNIFGASWEPTHWQELPEPPTSTGG